MSTIEIFSPTEQARWNQIEPDIWSLDSGALDEQTASSIARTLFDQPRWLQPHLLYDERGSELFEKICSLPEYYLTRTENAILEGEAGHIIELAPVECIVELGAGFSRKTLHLLEQQMAQRNQGTFAPIDVSLTALIGSREGVRERFPKTGFRGLLAHYEDGVSSIRRELPTLFAFLGSSIGNFDSPEFTQFFEHLASSMGSDDYLLLGVDRVKEVNVLERAYDDSRGVTAEFILNIFSNVNRIAGANFTRDKMRYLSRYNTERQRMEMYAVSTFDQEIRLSPLGMDFVWKKDESILIEISRKFEPRQLEQQLASFGFHSLGHFTDPKQWFSLLLFEKEVRAAR